MSIPRGYKVCALDGCDELFKIHGKQAYHHKDCRKAAKVVEEKRMKEHENYLKAKAEAKITTGSRRKTSVDEKFLTRGKIKYTGYTTL